MILFAFDLDNTIIHSYKKAASAHICVETMETAEGMKKLSYMTPEAFHMLQNLPGEICAVPVTTRSETQFRRISLFGKDTPFAVTSNGGTLLKNNAPDKEWRSRAESVITPALDEMKKGAALLEDDIHRSFEVRFVDESFIFTKSDSPPDTLKMLRERLDCEKISLHENGTKIYILPKGLNKGFCLKNLREKFSPDITVAAGDSAFDIPMLNMADIAVIPHDFPAEKISAKTLICPTVETGSFAEYILRTVTDMAGNGKV